MSAAYYTTAASVQQYIKLAKDVNGAELIEKLKPLLPRDSKVLEIGSGPGTDWKILNKYYQVIGSDNSEEFLNHLKSKNPNGKFLNIDAITLKTNEYFDGIYSNKVMHHLNDNELGQSLKKQHAVLRAKGVICHSFWKGSGTEVFKGLFVNYHEASDLRNLYQKYFNILHLGLYNEFEEDDSILLIAKKK